MSALRPSNELKNKVNINPVGNRINEATAEDFIEAGNILEDHADKIDALTGAATPNPNYGVYTSLTLLKAAHPTADSGAYAIIDAGVGNTPQIALWDNNDTDWVLGTVDDLFIYVANNASLPAPGTAGKIYVTLDNLKQYIWQTSQYNVLSPGVTEAPTDGKSYIRRNATWNSLTSIYPQRDTADVSVTKGLNWNFATFDYTMTADTTFTDTNLPTGNNTETATFYLSGNFTPTFPSYWLFGGGVYDGVGTYLLALECINGTSGSEKVACIITKLN